MFVGSFLPWVTVSTIFGTLSRSGVDGNGDGIFSAGLGAAAAGIGVAMLNRHTRPHSIGLTIVGVLGGLLTFVDVSNIQGRLGDIDTDAALASVGIGLWMVGAGSVLCLVIGLEGTKNAKNPLPWAPFTRGAAPDESTGKPSESSDSQQSGHGISRCTTGAKIPRAQQREGEPCPFCGSTLTMTPTVTSDVTMKYTPWLQIALVVAAMAAGLLILYQTGVVETLRL